jgi:putative endonuclease
VKPGRAETGRWGEAIAAKHLQDKGYVIEARNWRPGIIPGEIDLIARDGPLLVFVEVRARHGDAYGAPEDSITPKKRAALEAAIAVWLDQHDGPDTPCRVDLIAIEFDARNAVKRIAHIEDAFV